jgi:hypothetical protein
MISARNMVGKGAHSLTERRIGQLLIANITQYMRFSGEPTVNFTEELPVVVGPLRTPFDLTPLSGT